VVNIADWAGFCAVAGDVNAGDVLLYNGVMYKNLTGSLTADAPDIDAVNWKRLLDETCFQQIPNPLTADFVRSKGSFRELLSSLPNGAYTMPVTPTIANTGTPSTSLVVWSDWIPLSCSSARFWIMGSTVGTVATQQAQTDVFVSKETTGTPASQRIFVTNYRRNAVGAETFNTTWKELAIDAKNTLLQQRASYLSASEVRQYASFAELLSVLPNGVYNMPPIPSIANTGRPTANLVVWADWPLPSGSGATISLWGIAGTNAGNNSIDVTVSYSSFSSSPATIPTKRVFIRNFTRQAPSAGTTGLWGNNNPWVEYSFKGDAIPTSGIAYTPTTTTFLGLANELVTGENQQRIVRLNICLAHYTSRHGLQL